MPTFWERAALSVRLVFSLYFCLFVILLFSHPGFEVGVWFLIVPVPVHCFLDTFTCSGNGIQVYLVQKGAQFFYLHFLGFKLLISKIVLFQLFCLAIKTLIEQFRHKLDTVLCLESKIQKSEFLNKKNV